MEIAESIKIKENDIRKLQKDNPNGKSKGNVFYMREEQPPRFQYAYLRYTLPLFNLRGLNYKVDNRETIYVIPGGGVYFSKRNYPYFDEGGRIILKLFPNNVPSYYTTKFIVCFLKSSFLLWYCKNKYDDINLYLPSVFNNIRYPQINPKSTKDKAIVEKIDQGFDAIVGKEKQYLIHSQKLKEKERRELTEKHNDEVAKIAYKIDHHIYELLNLSPEKKNCIEENLRLNEIYLPANDTTTLNASEN